MAFPVSNPSYYDRSIDFRYRNTSATYCGKPQENNHKPLLVYYCGKLIHYPSIIEWTLKTCIQRKIDVYHRKQKIGKNKYDSALVIFPPHGKQKSRCLDYLIEKGIQRIGTIMIGDGRFKLDHSVSSYPHVRFVFMEHFPGYPRVRSKLKLIAEKYEPWPVMSKSPKAMEVTPQQAVPASRRQHRCCFIGSVQHGYWNQYRIEFYKKLISTGLVENETMWKLSGYKPSWKGCVTFFGSFRDENNIDNGAYQEIMKNCAFGLVPAGTGADSFRMYDVLLAGGIPVIEGSITHQHLFPDHPFLTLPNGDWSKVNFTMSPYLKDNDKIDELQSKVISYRDRWIKEFRERVARKIEQELFLNG